MNDKIGTDSVLVNDYNTLVLNNLITSVPTTFATNATMEGISTNFTGTMEAEGGILICYY